MGPMQTRCEHPCFEVLDFPPWQLKIRYSAQNNSEDEQKYFSNKMKA